MTNWDRILLENHAPGMTLTPRIDDLFARQRQEWGLLREGEATLATIQTHALTCAGSRILVQANPGRKRSTHAQVDSLTIAARRCFLCPENMPVEERGIGLEELVVLPNPYPILRRHCTVPDRTHRPQRLAGRIAEMLALAWAVGPEMLVFYNGPRCGASAPDHFHFQACDIRGIPLLNELPIVGTGSWQRAPWQRAHRSFGRKMLLLADSSAERLQRQLAHALDALRRLAPADDLPAGEEPMFNLMALARDGQWLIILVPRAVHRPACYFASGDKRLAISPATLEMAGLLVVAEPDQLNRVDADMARTIYQEVSLDEARFEQFLQEVRT